MAQKRKLSDLFPTRWSFIIFILYMGLFINQGILVTASQTKNHQGYSYNTVMAVLLTELIKLWVSAGIFVQSVHRTNNLILDGAPSNKTRHAKKNASTTTRSATASYLKNLTKPITFSNTTNSETTTTSQSHYYNCICLILRSISAILFYFKCKPSPPRRRCITRLFQKYFKLLRNSTLVFFGELRQNSKVFFLYFIPAGLYCLYNNLAYTNLVNFDPTTYFLLLQFRVVVTGVVFQILFDKRLSKYQWLSLIFLTVGCMVKEVKLGWLLPDPDELPAEELQRSVGLENNKNGDSDNNNNNDGVKKLGFLDNPIGIVLIFLQVLCSSSAGVYNEFLLKRPTSSSSSSGGSQKQLPVLIQNVCLYIDSIICNLALLLFQGNLSSVMDFGALKNILTTPIILAVVLNNAAIGIVTSFFLAQLNSILKTFASALELMFTAVLCWLIFDIPIHLNTAAAILIVTLAIWLYSKEPVHNPATTSQSVLGGNKKEEEEDMQKMLNEELQDV